MYLHNGWKQLERARNLEVDCLLNFMYEGVDELRVKVFDDTMCRMHYHVSDNIGERDNNDTDDEQKPLV
jgi:hypothetical protein